jgi:hypothetical protein
VTPTVKFAGSLLPSHESKVLKHGHRQGQTSSTSIVRGDDRIWIYGITGSFVTFNNNQITSGQLIFFGSINLINNGQLAHGLVDAIGRHLHQRVINKNLLHSKARFVGSIHAR